MSDELKRGDRCTVNRHTNGNAVRVMAVEWGYAMVRYPHGDPFIEPLSGLQKVASSSVDGSGAGEPLMEAAADAVSKAQAHSVNALVEKLQQINRNILDEASRIGDTGRPSYHSLLGEAAGIRMALRFVREAAESCTCERNPACPEHGVTG